MPGLSITDFLKSKFPRLRDGDYDILSPADRRYNCIAWAAGDQTRFWWPFKLSGYYWPVPITSPATVELFISAFSTVGYSACENGELEVGTEKIAIYVGANGEPAHASRQRSDGKWLSKLGPFVDIVHATADAVGGSEYGEVARYMARPARCAPEP